MQKTTCHRGRSRAPLGLISLVTLLMAGCSEEDELTYNEDVRPIFSNGCTICHNADRPMGVNIANPFASGDGLVNSNFSVHEERCVNGNEPECSLPEKNVDPGRPENSALLAKVDWVSTDPNSCSIKRGGDLGGECMPLQIPRLTMTPDEAAGVFSMTSDTEVGKIYRWIANGAQNDEFFWTEVQPIFGDEDEYLEGVDSDGDGLVGPGRCSYCHYVGTPWPPALSAPSNGQNVRVTSVFSSDIGLVNARTSYLPRGTRVVPNDPDASFLLAKLIATEPNANVGAPMPYSFPPLREEQRETLRAWIADGAPNN